GTGLLAESKIDSANYLALLVQIFQCLLHPTVENHPAVDLNALLFVQVFRIANWGRRRAEVTGNFIATLFAFTYLAHSKSWFLQAVVRDFKSALLRQRRRALRSIAGVRARRCFDGGLR